jgi:hypothetical protein
MIESVALEGTDEPSWAKSHTNLREHFFNKEGCGDQSLVIREHSPFV